MTAPFDPEQQKMYDPTKDPSLKDIIDDVAVTRYLRSVLKYESDLPYQGPFGGGYPPPTAFRGDWMSQKWGWTQAERQGAGATAAAAPPEQPLRRAMTANRLLKVFVSCGYYDLVCSYYANEYVASQLEPALKDAGHRAQLSRRPRHLHRRLGADIDEARCGRLRSALGAERHDCSASHAA